MSANADWFTDPLGGLPDDQWDELAGDRFYSSAFWLRLCAFEGGDACGAVHVELPGGGRAAVPVVVAGDDPHPNVRWNDLLAARGLPPLPARGLALGQLRGYLGHLLAGPGVDPVAAAAGLLEAVCAARPPVAGDAPARVGLYLTTPDVVALRAAGVRALPVALPADSWIEIPPGGRPAWLASLGAHRARRVRSEARRFAAAGYKVTAHPLSEAYGEVARLAWHTEDRYGKASPVESYRAGFRRQGEYAGDRAEVLLCAADGEPAVGCCLYYRDRDTVYLRAVGFDYERLRGAAEYPTLTYWEPAGLPGVRRLHPGIETPEGKALRGAILRPLWLLDVSETSVLVEHEGAVRAHNNAFRDRLRASSPAVAAAMPAELWDEFF